ncbi:phosphatidate cytidylyltransferase [Syntrophomonas curvata]
MFKARVVTAIIGIPILLGVLYGGGLYWKAFFGLVALLAFYEYARMMANIEIKPLFTPGILLILLLLFKPAPYLYPGIFAILVLAVIITILKYPLLNIMNLSVSLFGAAYIGLLLSYTIDVVTLPQPFLIMLLALLLTWASDTGAYCAGKLWGKHKMMPALSPNKTWEGAAGGLALAAAVALAFFPITDMAEVNTAYALALGVGASIMAQLGDLFISGAKRYFQVKDTGKILPGHGGVLDRFDSFLLVVPLVYYYALYIIY